jgi:hypothetical protein
MIIIREPAANNCSLLHLPDKAAFATMRMAAINFSGRSVLIANWKPRDQNKTPLHLKVLTPQQTKSRLLIKRFCIALSSSVGQCAPNLTKQDSENLHK